MYGRVEPYPTTSLSPDGRGKNRKGGFAPIKFGSVAIVRVGSSSCGADLLENFLRRSEVGTAAMGVTKEAVEIALTAKLQPVHLVVIDTSGGCGASFDIEIATAAFEGKRLLERHRVVNTALTAEMNEIHALSIKKALTPEQWQTQKVETSSAA